MSRAVFNGPAATSWRKNSIYARARRTTISVVDCTLFIFLKVAGFQVFFFSRRICYTWSKGEALPSPSAQNHLRFFGRRRFLILGFFVLSFSLMMRTFSTTVRVVRIIPSTNAISATFFPSFLYFNYTPILYLRQVI